MAKHSPDPTDGLDAALAIHLSVYCAFAACFAFGLYMLMQPSRYPNPGLSAYKPPSAMVATYLPAFRPSRDSMPVVSADAETAKLAMAKAETNKADMAKPDTAAQAQADAQKLARERAEAQKRQRAAAARKEWRDPRMEYAERPFFGDYRPSF